MENKKSLMANLLEEYGFGFDKMDNFPQKETEPEIIEEPTPVEEPNSPVLWIVLGTAAVILLGAVSVLVIRRKK